MRYTYAEHLFGDTLKVAEVANRRSGSIASASILRCLAAALVV
jgi:hypothetical protein